MVTRELLERESDLDAIICQQIDLRLVHIRFYTNIRRGFQKKCLWQRLEDMMKVPS